MRIIYITDQNVQDKNSSSGTVYNIYKMLVDLGHEVVVVDNLKNPLILRVINKIKYKLLKKNNIPVYMNKLLLKLYAFQINKKINNIEYDLVFSPASSYYSYFNSKKPMVFFIDSNVGCMMDYYYNRKDYTDKAIKDAYDIENLAIRNAFLCVYASRWAMESAIENHFAHPQKVVAINRGANVDHDFTHEQILEYVEKRNISKANRKCQLLFVGKDWERKGGNIACDVVFELNKLGYDTTLVVVGCCPNIKNEYKEYVTIVGPLNKNKEEDCMKLQSLYFESDFFIMPSKAECQGISYIEACGCALPPIGCKTGGVGDVVIEGVTGIQLEVDADPSDYAKKIIFYMEHNDIYKKLAMSSYDYYKNNMTWKAVGERIFLEINSRLENNANEY